MGTSQAGTPSVHGFKMPQASLRMNNNLGVSNWGAPHLWQSKSAHWVAVKLHRAHTVWPHSYLGLVSDERKGPTCPRTCMRLHWQNTKCTRSPF